MARVWWNSNRYKEALGPLNEAIEVAKETPGAAYPTIAVTAKIGALTGLGHGEEALGLVGEEMRRVGNYHLAEHLTKSELASTEQWGIGTRPNPTTGRLPNMQSRYCIGAA